MEIVTEDTVLTIRKYLDLRASKALCLVCAKQNKTLSLPSYIANSELKRRDENGENILHRAVQCGIGVMHVEELIDRNPDLVCESDNDGNTALHRAVMSFAKNGTLHYMMVANSNSINKRNVAGFSPLHLIFRVHVFCMECERILREGGDFPTQLFETKVSNDRLFLLATQRAFETYKPPIDEDDVYPAFEFSMYSTLHYALKLFPESFQNIDINGQVPLHYAACMVQFDAIHTLIPAACPASCDITDFEGNTPLQIVVHQIYDNYGEMPTSKYVLPQRFEYGMETPRYLVLMVKLMVESCPAGLDSFFVENTMPIVEACENSNSLVLFLIKTYPDLLWQRNGEGELAFHSIDIPGKLKTEMTYTKKWRANIRKICMTRLKALVKYKQSK
jgi:ankyrin repeat protein